jgi:hypothetical protein
MHKKIFSHMILMITETNYHYNKWLRLTSTDRAVESTVTIDDMGTKTVANDDVITGERDIKSLNEGGSQVADGIKDTRDIETEFNKDINGYIAKITDGQGRVTGIQRSVHCDPVNIIRPDETYVDMTYDEETRDLVSTYDSDSESTTSTSYNDYGQTLTKTDNYDSSEISVWGNSFFSQDQP